jgi:hypothetical protein
MRITVFTGNQPRHISLIKQLATISDEVFAVQECNTIFPGEIEDFYKKSMVMQNYFSNVIEAEKMVFGLPCFLPGNVKSLSLKSGDLNKVSMDILKPALQSDYYVVFGSSFIKGDLIKFLVANRAINIHMGLSPYYRGCDCNFWALYDKRPDYVGSTIHLLSKGLDSGPILFHTLPKAEEVEPFLLGMHAVKSAHSGLVNAIKTGTISSMAAENQNKSLEIKYTRSKEFTDEIASKYLENPPTPLEVFKSLKNRDTSHLRKPYIT